jgi:hypothetical protein
MKGVPQSVQRMAMGSIPGGDWKFFSSPLVQTGTGAYPASYAVGTGGRIKWSGCEAYN